MTRTRSRSASLALELLGRIARGELAPGDPIDLQALERRHRVSRTVVREALADLGGKGLVVARPKIGTLVAAREHWNFLDPMLIALAVEQPGGNLLAREALELRTVVEPAIARAAAAHGSHARVRAVLDALRAMDRALTAVDFDGWCAGAAQFHQSLAAASGNRLLQSIDRSLAPVRAMQRASEGSTEWHGRSRPASAQRMLALQTAIGVAVARHQPARAASLSLQLAARDMPAGRGRVVPIGGAAALRRGPQAAPIGRAATPDTRIRPASGSTASSDPPAAGDPPLDPPTIPMPDAEIGFWRTLRARVATA